MDMESTVEESTNTKTTYNKTQLNPDTAFKRHVYHRDMFAHFFRWSHILKNLRIGMKVLDWGCGSGNMLEVMYRNKYKGEKYLGLDVRKQTIKKCQEKYNNVDWAEFMEFDLCMKHSRPIAENEWDMITCFEVIEHIGKHNARQFISNIALNMLSKTTLYISTPVYDPVVGAAANHIIDGEIGEFTFQEMKDLLSEFFDIENVWGTFASQKDYKQHLSESQLEFFNEVHKYFDSNILSNLMAPFVKPEMARNCLWVCKCPEV